MSNLKASGTNPAMAGRTRQPKTLQASGHSAESNARVVADLSSDYVVSASEHIVRLDPQQRIDIIRRGIPAASVGRLSARMGLSKELLISSLRLSRATINRKEREGVLLSSDESERVLGVETLIDIVQTMVEESGDPEGFDAPLSLGAWLSEPLPALAGATPASYLDTFEGQKLVADLLAMIQSGAYA